MKTFAQCFVLAAALLAPAPAAAAKTAEFGDVVKLIESHYGVRHVGMSLLAKAGVKVGQIVANRLTRYSEYGSAKFVVFEDQDFSSDAGRRAGFAPAMRDALAPAWEPLVEVRMREDAGQTYVYTREAGKHFRVLVVFIGERDATAVEVRLAPAKLAALLKDPDAMGKTLTDEAAEDTQQ